MARRRVVIIGTYQGQSLCQRTTPSLSSYQVLYLTIKQEPAAPPLPPSQGSLDLWDRGLQPNASLHLVPKDPSWRASSLLGDSSCPAKWQTAMCLISRGLTWETLEVSYLSFKGWRRPRKGDDEDDRSHGDVL